MIWARTAVRPSGMTSADSNRCSVRCPTPAKRASSAAEIPIKARAARIWAPEIIDKCADLGVYYAYIGVMWSNMPEVRHSASDVSELLRPLAGAYSPRTLRGYAADLRGFAAWTQARECQWLPAEPDLVAAFVDDQVERHSLATIKRRLCAIAFAHRLRDLVTPTEAHVVRMAVRRAVRRRASRPKQVRGLTNVIRARIVSRCAPTLAGLRDAALISVGYDTLCRSSELAAMTVDHLTFESDGIAVIEIPRSKSDVTGKGRIAYLSPATTRLLAQWLARARLRTGPLFRGLHLNRPSHGPLATSSIRRLIKRATARAGFSAEVAAELSGHSMRIGAAQDMMVAGFDALAIMQAGGWRSANVVLRYVENAATRDLQLRRWNALTVGERSLESYREPYAAGHPHPPARSAYGPAPQEKSVLESLHSPEQMHGNTPNQQSCAPCSSLLRPRRPRPAIQCSSGKFTSNR
jgi:integrase/recombinase XerD